MDSVPTQEELQKEIGRLQAILGHNGDLEHALAQARERLNLALSAGNLAWWEMDCRTGKVDFNERKAYMLEYDPAELADVHYSVFTDMLHPDDYEKAMDAMRKHLSGEKELYETEYRIRTKSGRYLWFYDRGSITDRDEAGRPLIVKGIVFDISERKEAELALARSEEKLRQANALKDKLFSIVAHDLRNSIGNLALSLKLLADQPDLLQEQQRREQLSMLKRVSGSIVDLLQNLLMWARAQQGAIAFTPHRTDLAPIIASRIEIAEAGAQLKGIRIHTRVPPGLQAYADPEMVAIVLTNLLSNALKYTRENDTVTIHAEPGESEVTIRVTDTGVGMSQEVLSDLFTADVRSRRGTRRETGTGLGLLLCKEFVEKNGGRIWAESEPGKGSTFSFTLPAAQIGDGVEK
ncbi:MAG: PAS domain-containing protein [Chitinivibrionales bacterium]|nr:PAS domain-containing protein [Chitinivibrionales bacterium]